MKLYKVTLTDFSDHYAIAPDAETAYQLVYSYMRKYKIMLKNIELMACDKEYPDARSRLYLSNPSRAGDKIEVWK